MRSFLASRSDAQLGGGSREAHGASVRACERAAPLTNTQPPLTPPLSSDRASLLLRPSVRPSEQRQDRETCVPAAQEARAQTLISRPIAAPVPPRGGGGIKPGFVRYGATSAADTVKRGCHVTAGAPCVRVW